MVNQDIYKGAGIYKNGAGGGGGGGDLPEGYQRLFCFSFNGNANIRFKSNKQFTIDNANQIYENRIRLDVKFNDVLSSKSLRFNFYGSSDKILFGYFINPISTGSEFQVFYKNSTSGYNKYKTYSKADATSLFEDQFFLNKLNKNHAELLGNEVLNNVPYSAINLDTSFDFNFSDNPIPFSFFSIQIKDLDGNVIYDFIPVYNTNNGIISIYEKNTNDIFTVTGDTSTLTPYF